MHLRKNMKIRKNSAVKFVATVYDKWGIIPEDRTFSFSIRYCHVPGSKDNDNFNKFNKLVERCQVKEIKIAGEVVKDFPKALEIIKEETSKWEKALYFKTYRVAKHDVWGRVIWLPIKDTNWNFIVDIFGWWRHKWYPRTNLDTYFVYENNTETGEFSKMSDEHQVKFRNDVEKTVQE